jgi:type II secretory pathway pseudopilin PulG
MRRVGFTIVEVIIVVGISSLLITGLLRLLVIGYPLHKTTYLQQRSTESARLQLERISKSLREARYADTGAYPLVDMNPQRIIFYSDIDADATTERIRYELNGSALERGVTEPSGSPLVYDVVNDEAVTIVASNVRNGEADIFTYYDGNYPADQTPLTPVDLTEVKYIQFYLLIDADEAVDPPPIEVRSQVQLRNLKTNLGET